MTVSWLEQFKMNSLYGESFPASRGLSRPWYSSWETSASREGESVASQKALSYYYLLEVYKVNRPPSLSSDHMQRLFPSARSLTRKLPIRVFQEWLWLKLFDGDCVVNRLRVVLVSDLTSRTKLTILIQVYITSYPIPLVSAETAALVFYAW